MNMNTVQSVRSQRSLPIRVLAAAGTLAIAALTGCGADAGTNSGSTASSTANPELAAAVAKLQKPLDAYPIPTEPIAGVASLAGKTVYYIPISMQAPQFSVTQKALTAALQTVGMKVQACDGKGSPSDIDGCIRQATEAKAATIVTDAIPYGLGQNAFNAAQAAGIPVIISNQIPDPAQPASKTLNYIATAGTAMQVALSQWIALDSGGGARVLINQSTDGPSPAAYVEAGSKVFAKDCPNCTVTINKISTSSFTLIPSSTSSELLKNPDIGYVMAQYEQFLQPTQTGVQQSGQVSSVKGLTGAAQLGALQALASNNFLYAAGAQASAFQGWVDADAVLRLSLGLKVPEYTIPVRLFTRDTIKDTPLTEEAQLSGEWFGPKTFTADFKKLWNVG
jgi:ribose transport system substrate-binding protein